MADQKDAELNKLLAEKMMREAHVLLRPLIDKYGPFINVTIFEAMKSQIDDGVVHCSEALHKLEDFLLVS